MRHARMMIPPRLEALLGLVREDRKKCHDHFYGLADFFLPEPGAELLDTLTAKRWPGMFGDLLPFADDGIGNLFCLVLGRSETAQRGAVVHWMYETYRATPIASSFDGFLDWLWLTTNYTALYGVDDVMDQDHVDRKLKPLFSRLGITPPSIELMRADPTHLAMHQAMVGRDPKAPGSLVSTALLGPYRTDDLRRVQRLQAAVASFPEYMAAHLALVESFSALGNEDGVIGSLFDAMHSPLVYGGDRMVPFLGDIPEVDVTRVAEMLATNPTLHNWSLEDPLWEVILRDDPMDPVAWLGVAVDYANSGVLEEAVIMAENALLLGLNVPEELDVVALLMELYEALGWEWHLKVAQDEASKFEKRFQR